MEDDANNKEFAMDEANAVSLYEKLSNLLQGDDEIDLYVAPSIDDFDFDYSDDN